jgi:hypothetical protein
MGGERFKGADMKRRGFKFHHLILIIIGVFVLLNLAVNLNNRWEAATRHKRIDFCAQKLQQLGFILQYYQSDNYGKYPTPEKWCDLLFQSEPSPPPIHPSHDYYYHSFAINPNCEPNSPDNVVLAFPSKGGWNSYGGAELLSFEYHGGKSCYILLNSYSVKSITPEEVAELNWGKKQTKKLPTTYEEAIESLINTISDEDKNEVKMTPKEDLIKYHFSWGMGIRNDFGLWGENKLLLQSCAEQAGVEQIHPDDASMLIIEGVWEALQKE